MLERINEMPAGTIGFQSTGKLSREDYKKVLEPALRQGIEAGEIRMLYRIPSFDGLEPSAWFEDARTGLGLGFGHHSAWKRSAIVTDIEWLGKAFKLFAWMTPGEVMVFPLNQMDEAKAWVAA
jgi:SpoIIAA-like